MTKQSLTRVPKAPPFPVGVKIVCIADNGDGHAARRDLTGFARDIVRYPEDWVRVSGKGVSGTIVRVIAGRRGTGQQLRDDDGPMFYEDTGEPIRDETEDGISVISIEGYERLVRYENRKDWKVVK